MSERIESLLVELISELKKSSQGQQRLAQAITQMAESNLELIDQLVGDEPEDAGAPDQYLDGGQIT